MCVRACACVVRMAPCRYPANPWGGSMGPAAAVQKVCHVALQMLCAKHSGCQVRSLLI